MNTIHRFLFVVLMSLLFVSCNDDEGYSLGDVWRSMATVENPDDESYFFFTLDNGKRMWTAATSNPQYKPKDGQRIIADYTILSDGPESGSYQHDVKLLSAYKVLTKGIFDITPETQDSIGNDPVKVEDIWIGNDYLNVQFVYKGQNKAHFINLVSDALKQYDDGSTHLEFRHHANGDAPTYNSRGIVSFDLKSLQKDGVESLPLAIHVLESDESDEKIYELNYSFDGSSDTERSFSVGEELKGEHL